MNFYLRSIQQRLVITNTPNSIAKGWLAKDVSNGVLSINVKRLKFLKQKQRKSRELNEEIILSGKKPLVLLVVFEDIDEEEMIKVAAMKTKRGSSPSGLDADAWRKKLSLNSYSYGNIDLRTVIASAIKKFA